MATRDRENLRKFSTGATRDTDSTKFDYEGAISPLVTHRYAEYMHKHRHMKDGSLRPSDNWTKGIPRREYMKSLYRHLMDVWLIMRGYKKVARTQDLEEALCACIFNASGLLHELLIGRDSR